jgi:hypothetical protein
MHRLASLVRPRSLLVAFALAVALAGLGAGQASAGVDTDHIYRLTTNNSLALDVQGGSTADLAPVVQWPVNGGQNQEWQFVALGDNQYEVVNYKSHKCLVVQGAAAGSPVVQYSCIGVSSERFTISNPLPYAIRLRSVRSGLYVNDPASSISWGTQFIQWYSDFNSDWSEYFTYTPLA